MHDRARRATVAFVALAVITALMLLVRERLDKAHVALVYVLVVVAGSASSGRTTGLWLSGFAFLAFDFLFLPPFYTLIVSDPLDWLVLITFLVTGVVSAQLLFRAQSQAALARRREQELERLGLLGAETLSAARAEAALFAISRVIRSTFAVDSCEVYRWKDGVSTCAAVDTARDNQPVAAPDITNGGLVTWVATNALEALELMDGTTRTRRAPEHPHLELMQGDARALLMPLVVRDEAVGVLRLANRIPLHIDATQLRYLETLSQYAALGLERLRHSEIAERVEALREADRLKDTLIATVSHDLRTPLTTIRGLAHQLADRGDEEALIIIDEVDRLDRLVADLLDLSRLSAGVMPTQMLLNAAEDLMGAALQRIDGVRRGREIRASLDTAEPMLLGRFDLSHALRIVSNLFENAFKYAPADAPIDFAVSRRGEWLEFTVADRGPGVADSERERIFQPFYRPPSAPADSGSAGLGLAIARKLAEAQGGSLTWNPREGGGSVFALRLPAADLVSSALDGE